MGLVPVPRGGTMAGRLAGIRHRQGDLAVQDAACGRRHGRQCPFADEAVTDRDGGIAGHDELGILQGPQGRLSAEPPGEVPGGGAAEEGETRQGFSGCWGEVPDTCLDQRGEDSRGRVGLGELLGQQGVAAGRPRHDADPFRIEVRSCRAYDLHGGGCVQGAQTMLLETGGAEAVALGFEPRILRAHRDQHADSPREHGQEVLGLAVGPVDVVEQEEAVTHSLAHENCHGG